MFNKQISLIAAQSRSEYGDYSNPFESESSVVDADVRCPPAMCFSFDENGYYSQFAFIVFLLSGISSGMMSIEQVVVRDETR
tara:strand:- start:19 stop:264 length:246 start_codon:yes stop_codon:yes gene_type:complete